MLIFIKIILTCNVAAAHQKAKEIAGVYDNICGAVGSEMPYTHGRVRRGD